MSLVICPKASKICPEWCSHSRPHANLQSFCEDDSCVCTVQMDGSNASLTGVRCIEVEDEATECSQPCDPDPDPDPDLGCPICCSYERKQIKPRMILYERQHKPQAKLEKEIKRCQCGKDFVRYPYQRYSFCEDCRKERS